MKLYNLLIIFCILPQANCFAASKQQADFNNVEYVSNYDADTITVNLKCDIDYFCRNAKIRVAHIDTPELRTKDDCERYTATQAKHYTEYLLRTAKQIDLKNCTNGKYHREVCEVLIDGIDLSKSLINKRYAYKYEGGTKQKIDWCKY